MKSLWFDRLAQGLEVVERIIGRLLMEDRACDGRHGHVAVCLDEYVHDRLEQRRVEERRGGDLLVGNQQHWSCRLIDRPLFLIPKNADDGVGLDHPGFLAAQIDLVTQRITVAKDLTGERLGSSR